MAPYHSHLETLIKARTYRQDIVYRELVEQESLISIEEILLQKWLEASDAAVDQIKKMQTLGGAPAEIQILYTFIKNQGERIQTQQEKIATQRISLEKKRDELNEVVQEKQIVEKIESRQRKTYFAAIKKKEDHLLDEIAGRLKKGQR